MDAAAIRREHDEAVREANRKLLDSGALVDVTVTVGDVAFPCHKSVLAALSGFFRSMFRVDFTEKQARQVTLPASDLVSSETFSVLRKWMYGGDLYLSLDIAEILLPSAFYLQMGKTVDMLVDYFKRHYLPDLPVTRRFHHLSLADSCGLSVLRDVALKGMAQNFDAVTAEVTDFLELKVQDLLTLLSMDQLKAHSEGAIFTSAFAWIHHDDSRLDYLGDILKLLRLNLVSVGTIRKALDIKVMSSDSECCNILLDALAGHPSHQGSLEPLRRDYLDKFIERTNSEVLYEGQQSANANNKTPAEGDGLCSEYGDIWRDAYETLARTSPDMADVTVTVDGEDFRCHKAVLYGWSGFCQRRFAFDACDLEQPSAASLKSDSSPYLGEGSGSNVDPGSYLEPGSDPESECNPEPQRDPEPECHRKPVSVPPEHISLAGDSVTRSSFSAILRWIYSGELQVTADNVCDVMMAARCLQLDRVMALLDRFFNENLASAYRGGLVIMLLESRKHGIDDVHDKCFSQVLGNFGKVCASPEFLDLLDVETLLSFLLDENLRVKREDVVLEAALSWLRHSPCRLMHAPSVLGAVRLCFVGSALLNDCLDFAFSSRDTESFTLLRHVSFRDTDPRSLNVLQRDHPTVFERRSPKTFYDELRMTSRVGDTEGGGYMTDPHAVCVHGDLVLVADRGTNRLVAFRRPGPAARHSYVCHVDIDNPWCCVSDKDTDTIYVRNGHSVTIVEWTPSRELRVTGKLTAGDQLHYPYHLALDPDRQHLYVACGDGVHKVSLATDAIVATLCPPTDVKGGPERVAIIGSTLMANYITESKLVLHTDASAPGHVITPQGLQEPWGLGEDGINFLVGDNVDRCMFVISPSGETLTTVNTWSIVPWNVTVHDDTVYIVPSTEDGFIYLMQ